MPLPDFKQFSAVWVEKTKASHGHGGEGWEFGTCLWSPTTNKSGHQIYRNMTVARSGDLVLHFYEDVPFGKEQDHYFCGISIVSDRATVVSEQPPRAGEWAGRGNYFRVGLSSFSPFDDAVPLRGFAKDYNARILESLAHDEDSPFINYGGDVRLAQGKYLSRCGSLLYELLSQAAGQKVDFIATTGSELPARTFDYEEYVEGQRSKRETWFFSRNPKLAKDAKERDRYTCQACAFRFEDRYGELGEGFIEVHHLDPLSERRSAANDGRLTTLAQVASLCPNCHRMAHRLIRRLGRSVSVEDLRSQFRTSSRPHDVP